MSTIKDSESQFNFNAQAALIYYVEEIMNKYIDFFASTQQNSPLIPSLSNKQYKNFVTIRSRNEISNPRTPREVLKPINTNSLINKDKEFAKFFSRFPEALRSAITCNMQIFKCFIYKGQEYDWLVPLSRGISFDFSTGFQKSTSDIFDEIQKNKFIENNVANSSFTFEFKGINEFDISTNLEATLELTFDDPIILTKRFNTFQGNYKNFFSNIPKDLSSETIWQFSYADLISNIPYDYEKNKVDLNNFRIKALTKFTVDKTKFDIFMAQATAEAVAKNKPLNTPFQNIEQFQSLLNKCSIILYLIPHSHDLTVNPDNKLTIKINYVASSHGLLHSPDKANILNSSSYFSNLNFLKQEINKVIKEIDTKKENAIKSQPNIDTGEKAEERRKKIEEEFKDSKDGKPLYEQKDILEKQLELKKSEIYSEVINKLISDGLYIIKIRNESLNIKRGVDVVGSGDTTTVVDTAEITKTSIINSKKQITYFNHVSSPYNALLSLGINEEAAKNIINRTNLSSEYIREIAFNFSFFGIGENTPSEQQIADLTKQIEEAKKISQNSAAIGSLNASENEQIISFVFLGDLLEKVFSCFTPIEEKPKIFVGPIQLKIPLIASDEMTDDLAYEKNQTITINLADVPISFNLLTKFWSKLVDNKPDSITIHSFLYELIETLLKPVLGPEYFEDYGNINNKLKIGSLSVNLPNGDDKTNIFTNQQINEPMLGPISKEKFIEGYEKAINNFDSYIKNNGTSTYIFIFDASNYNVIGNNGDQEKDLQDGIYHLTLNTGGSLIKRINFSKLDMVGLREGLAVQEGSNKNLLALKQAYKIDVELVPGLTIYKPGDIMFVKPYIFQGNSGVVELSNTLGFIGYYLITSAKYTWNKSNTDMSCSVSGKLIAWLDKDGKSVSIKGN